MTMNDENGRSVPKMLCSKDEFHCARSDRTDSYLNPCRRCGQTADGRTTRSALCASCTQRVPAAAVPLSNSSIESSQNTLFLHHRKRIEKVGPRGRSRSDGRRRPFRSDALILSRPNADGKCFVGDPMSCGGFRSSHEMVVANRNSQRAYSCSVPGSACVVLQQRLLRNASRIKKCALIRPTVE